MIFLISKEQDTTLYCKIKKPFSSPIMNTKTRFYGLLMGHYNTWLTRFVHADPTQGSFADIRSYTPKIILYDGVKMW